MACDECPANYATHNPHTGQGASGKEVPLRGTHLAWIPAERRVVENYLTMQRRGGACRGGMTSGGAESTAWCDLSWAVAATS